MSKNTSNVIICLKLECICFILFESKINDVSFCWRFSEHTSCRWPMWHSTRQARGKVSLFFLTFTNKKIKDWFLRSSQVVQLVTDWMRPSLGFPDSDGYRGVRPALAPTGKPEFPLCVCNFVWEALGGVIEYHSWEEEDAEQSLGVWVFAWAVGTVNQGQAAPWLVGMCRFKKSSFCLALFWCMMYELPRPYSENALISLGSEGLVKKGSFWYTDMQICLSVC